MPGRPAKTRFAHIANSYQAGVNFQSWQFERASASQFEVEAQEASSIQLLNKGSLQA